MGALSTRDLNSMTLALPNEVLATRNIHEPINVLYNKEGFSVVNDKKLTRVKSYDVAPELRKMDVSRAAQVLAATQLRVSKLSNGEYTIDRHGELKGGGIICASIAYFGTKAVCYGAAIAAGGAAVAATGGGILGGILGLSSFGAGLAAPFAAKVVGVGIASTGLGKSAAVGTALFVTAHGAATVAAIESAAMSAAAIGALPFLP